MRGADISQLHHCFCLQVPESILSLFSIANNDFEAGFCRGHPAPVINNVSLDIVKSQSDTRWLSLSSQGSDCSLKDCLNQV